MADKSAIEWTDASWNPIRARSIETGRVGWYCTHKSPGCVGCYAEAFNRPRGTGVDFKPQLRGQVEIFLDEKMLARPARWTRPRMIFPCSMTDLFGEFVPDDFIDRMFAVMASTPRHKYQIVTKRPDRMAAYVSGLRDRWSSLDCHPDLDFLDTAWPRWEDALANVWLGCSVEDQRRADERRPAMAALAEQGWKTWASYEPALGAVDWTGWEFLRWLVSGGQSGHQARPSHPDWHRAARDFCDDRGIAYFFKQWGEWLPVYASAQDPRRLILMAVDGRRDGDIPLDQGENDDAHPYWTAWYFERVGKKAAGRELDGRTHDDMPMRGAL